MQVFVYCSILLLESCSGSLELPKRARGFQRSVWVSFLLSTNTLSLFMSLLHPCRALHTHTRACTGTQKHVCTLADAAMLLYFLTVECLCPMIIVNLIDAVTWSVMGFQVIAEAVWKKHRFFLRRKGASAELGLKKKKKTPLFWLAFLLPLLSRCWNANSLTPHAGGKRDIYSSFFLSVRKFLLAPSSPR